MEQKLTKEESFNYWKKLSKEESFNYWKKLSEGVYRISGSEYIIKDYKKYNKWHEKNNYIFLNDDNIIDKINNIVNN
jgi:hypothetical protein